MVPSRRPLYFLILVDIAYSLRFGISLQNKRGGRIDE